MGRPGIAVRPDGEVDGCAATQPAGRDCVQVLWIENSSVRAFLIALSAEV